VREGHAPRELADEYKSTVQPLTTVAMAYASGAGLISGRRNCETGSAGGAAPAEGQPQLRTIRRHDGVGRLSGLASQLYRCVFSRCWTPSGPLIQVFVPSVKAVQLSALRHTIRPPALFCNPSPFTTLCDSSVMQAPTMAGI
jgi:hypothetical protein